MRLRRFTSSPSDDPSESAPEPQRPRRLATRRLRRDDGYVLALSGLLIVPLIVFTAFAVDLGAWYAQGAKMQRAADAAALAGVVWLPDTSAAQTAARDSLQKNGFTTANSTIGYSFDTTHNNMTVTVSKSATQYFSKVVLQSETLNRTATAQFNLPIPLGSPLNLFGNQLTGAPTCTDPIAACAGAQEQLWAAIQGPYTRHQDGDPYATKCPGNSAAHNNCDGALPMGTGLNPTYRTSGYIYAIDVPAAAVGSSMQVSIYDGIASQDNTYGNKEGDSVYGSGTNGYDKTDTTFRTQFEIFDNDGSDYTTSTDPSYSLYNGVARTTSCTNAAPSVGKTPGRLQINSTDPVTTYKDRWVTLCTFVPTRAGVYPLVVTTSSLPGTTQDTGGGYNAYSLKAVSGSSSQPQIYAIKDMSIWSPNANSSSSSGAVSRFYLANIKQENAGKVLILDLYDPGDGSCTNAGCTGFSMQFRGPPSGANATVPTDTGATYACTYNTAPSTSAGGGTLNGSSSSCTIPTLAAGSSNGIYNGGWLRVRIPIPAGYTCSTDCWWTVKYSFSTGSPTDRTVWSAGVVGDPVHLTN